ncbi:hypothetical protein CSM15_003343 [Salmonella enterica subsp. diarizonae]|nr:hypothetical protein [Salmonella enterica subsp. diarizonae]
MNHSHKIILSVIFIINHKIIPDMMFTHLVENHSGYDLSLNRHYQTERAGWMRKK